MRNRSAVLASWLLVAACSTGPGLADLANNPDLYLDVGFVTKLTGDRSVFVAPVLDERQSAGLPESLSGFPIIYDTDARWDRAVAMMVDDLLRRELAGSGLFASIQTRAANADVVVQPTLQTFLTAQMEMMSGGRAIAETGLRIRVWGPATDGRRQLVHDSVYRDRQMTGVERRTVARHLLAGRSMRATMMRVMHGFDGANLGRSGMPVAPLPVPGGR